MTTLSGQITLHGGSKAATSATVELINATGDVVDQVQVDDDGKYHYHLAPGEWTLRVWDAHGHRGDGVVALSEGDGHILNIDLGEPEGGH